MKTLSVTAISDTHEHHFAFSLKKTDLLVHTGDITFRGDLRALIAFNEWLGKQPHKYKIVLAGNHDLTLEKQSGLAKQILTNCIYLEDSGTEIEGFKIWGSPQTPEFNAWAFNRQRGPDIAKYWQQIPIDTDLLLTHGPPHGILDLAPIGGHVGCEDLLKRVLEIKPQAHVFGHIHEGYGEMLRDGIIFINASMMDGNYRPVNPPMYFELVKEPG